MKTLRKWWIRWMLKEAQFCATVVQADMLAAPAYLIKLRGRIADLSAQLASLEH